MASALKADRAGFEPAVGLAPYAGLANRYLQPLGHLSGGWVSVAQGLIEARFQFTVRSDP
jgi:hypothetical protein